MGLLDQVLSGVLANMGDQGGQRPQPSALQGMLGSLFSGVPGGQNTTGVGGLQGLLSRFEAQGLGHLARSWIDPNQQSLPVTPEQLQNVLGDSRVQDMAARTGMSPALILGQLAQFLPQFVDKLTPNGQVPQPHEDPTLAEFGQGTAGGEAPGEAGGFSGGAGQGAPGGFPGGFNVRNPFNNT